MKLCSACKYRDNSSLSNVCSICLESKLISIYDVDIDKLKELFEDENFCKSIKRNYKHPAVYNL